MTLFEAHIVPIVIAFFREKLVNITSIKEANIVLQEVCGIHSFFENEHDLAIVNDNITASSSVVEEPNRRAYGDFQTNVQLANSVTSLLHQKNIQPELVIEPTCGKGNFILAALQQFSTIQKIVGIEIYLPYVWETKFRILELFLEKKALCQPNIEIRHQDIFTVDLKQLVQQNQALQLLIIGNPPWITNAALTTLDSDNLPKKSNFKHLKGLDAITGKGNFDIGEYISLQLLQYFDRHDGHFAFLIKNSVVKNIVQEQPKHHYHIGHIRQLNIDAKKEFKVAVNASLCLAQLNTTPAYTCQEQDFYTQETKTKFGWEQDKFVYSIADYHTVQALDDISPFVWRQGMKHDCSKIMELEQSEEHYINGFKELVVLEEDLLFGLIKSSDLKHETLQSHRKTTIVTQKKIGQDTHYIKDYYPKTYTYLDKNRAYFDKRKSSIYKGKPPFSIFGIGNYSFKKYKVAISGMYQRTTFSLVLPNQNKPRMLDDTCYFIGFDTLVEAQIAQKILNSTLVQALLKAIIFPDAKRPITKNILMRIDLKKAYHLLCTDKRYADHPDWKQFEQHLTQKTTNLNQMKLF
ncbi:MAG: hypothetical protein AB8E82_03175 [Aureispira sp.]